MKTLATLLLTLLLVSCASTGTDADNSNPTFHRTGTPSPLNTSANPWNQVNPQNQAAYQATRGR